MPQCPRCQKDLDEDARFCPNCGAQLGTGLEKVSQVGDQPASVTGGIHIQVGQEAKSSGEGDYCPVCGEYRSVQATFRCGKCGRAHLCLSHRDPQRMTCTDCSRQAVPSQGAKAETPASSGRPGKQEAQPPSQIPQQSVAGSSPSRTSTGRKQGPGKGVLIGLVASVVVLGLIGVVALGGPLGSPASRLQSQPPTPTPIELNRQITLDAGTYSAIPLRLKAGDLVEGSFVVGGASNLDIAFSVKDPDAREVIPSTRYRSYSFTFRSQQDGVHYLNFDNSYSLFTGKVISVTVKHPKR